MINYYMMTTSDGIQIQICPQISVKMYLNKKNNSTLAERSLLGQWNRVFKTI